MHFERMNPVPELVVVQIIINVHFILDKCDFLFRIFRFHLVSLLRVNVVFVIVTFAFVKGVLTAGSNPKLLVFEAKLIA
jgi:hypothetical protein